MLPANISTRGFVQTEANVVIGGFLLGGSDETTEVIVHARVPSLNDDGVSNTLADPTLDLRDSNGTLVAENDNWQEDAAEAAEIAANGLAPEHPAEAAIAASLPPGDYTAIVAGAEGGTGVGLIEVYSRR